MPKVIIVGAGIGGLALAIGLVRYGVYDAEDLLVIEKRDRASVLKVLGGLQIAPNGMQVLNELGVESEFRKLGCEAHGMRFFNQDGEFLADAPFQSPDRVKFTPVNGARASLVQVLLSECERIHIQVKFDIAINRVKTSGEMRTEIELENEEMLYASHFVVGCDGINSSIRPYVQGINIKPEYTGLFTMGGFLPSSLFASLDSYSIDPLRLDMIFGAQGFFGFGKGGPDTVMWWNSLPLSESEAQELEESIRIRDGSTIEERQKKTARFHEILRNNHADWDNEVIENVLKNVTPANTFVGSIYDMPDLETWHHQRVVLLGDSAHAVSPHSGQGASMALEDVLALSLSLKPLSLRSRDSVTLEELSDSFATYEKTRKQRVADIIAVGRYNSRSKGKLGWFGCKVRDFFIRYLMSWLLHKQSIWMYGDALRK